MCAGAFNAERVCVWRVCVCLCVYLISTPTHHPRPSQQGSTPMQGESSALQQRIYHRLFSTGRRRTNVDAASRGHPGTHTRTLDQHTATSILFPLRLDFCLRFFTSATRPKKKKKTSQEQVNSQRAAATFLILALLDILNHLTMACLSPIHSHTNGWLLPCKTLPSSIGSN